MEFLKQTAKALILGVIVSYLALNIKAQYAVYDWQQEYYANIDGQDKLVFTWQFTNSKLATGELYGNGKQDLLVGIENGSVAIFKNEGSVEKPKYKLQELRLSGFGANDQKNKFFRDYAPSKTDPTHDEQEYKSGHINRPLDFGAAAAPALIDLYGDGLLDLVVGDKDGRITTFRNIGTKTAPQFYYDYDNPIVLIPDSVRELYNFNKTVPSFCDINNDGATDLLVGTGNGKVYIFYGFRNNRLELNFNDLPSFILDVPGRKSVAPSCINWENKDISSIIVGNEDGSLSYIKNIGTSFSPKFDSPVSDFYRLDIGGNAAPHVVTLGDNNNYLLFGSINSEISQYQIKLVNGKNQLWLLNENITDYQRLMGLTDNISLSSGDIFGNNKQDIVLGNRQGSISLYENLSDGNSIKLSKITDNLFPNNILPYAAPEVVPASKGGKAALLVGVKNGEIHYFEDIGTKGDPKFQLLKPRAITLPNINNPIVRVVNLTNQGDYSLIIGGQGGISYYKSSGSYNEPMFEQEKFELFNIVDKKNSFIAPSIFNWNKFLTPNVIVGSETGELEVYSLDPHQSPLLPDLPVDFQTQLARSFKFPRWNFQIEMPEIRPFFFDIENSGKVAMMVSNLHGDLLLFLQKSSSNIDYKKEYQFYLDQQKKYKLDAIRQNIRNLLPKGIEPKFVADPKLNISTKVRKPVPAVGHLRSNLFNDLAVGMSNGEVAFYLNNKDKQNFQLQYKDSIYLPKPEGNAAPMFIDLDQDGNLDLIVGTGSGKIYYYRNLGKGENYKFALQPDFFKGFVFGQNAVPSKVYVKGKKFPDLFIGDIAGKVSYMSNQSSVKDKKLVPKFSIVSRDYLNFNTNSAIAPRFDDLNNDGIPELIVGTDQGDVKIYQYLDKNKTWVPRPDWTQNLKFGYGAAPAFGEFTTQGVKDMLVGDDSGKISYLRNTAVNPELIKNIEEQELTKTGIGK